MISIIIIIIIVIVIVKLKMKDVEDIIQYPIWRSGNLFISQRFACHASSNALKAFWQKFKEKGKIQILDYKVRKRGEGNNNNNHY